MRLFHLRHPDEADDLPAGFADWALAWDATEKEVESERIKEESARARAGG